MVTPYFDVWRERISQELRKLADEIATFKTTYRANYQAAIVDEMHELQTVGAADVNLIFIAVYDAARRYHSVHWWPGVIRADARGGSPIRAYGVVGLVLVVDPVSASHQPMIHPPGMQARWR
jgi:hypothetical protein